MHKKTSKLVVNIAGNQSGDDDGGQLSIWLKEESTQR
jgi:hypothetical protein